MILRAWPNTSPVLTHQHKCISYVSPWRSYLLRSVSQALKLVVCVCLKIEIAPSANFEASILPLTLPQVPGTLMIELNLHTEKYRSLKQC